MRHAGDVTREARYAGVQHRAPIDPLLPVSSSPDPFCSHRPKSQCLRLSERSQCGRLLRAEDGLNAWWSSPCARVPDKTHPTPGPSTIGVAGLLLALAVLVVCEYRTQGAQSSPTFEVVSIKRNTSQASGSNVAVQPGGRLIITNVPVSALVLLAFELQDYFQTDDLPDWTRTEAYDIEAKAPAGVPIAFPGQGTPLPRMLQAMLADRMKLRTHVEKRNVPMFALVKARTDGALGPGLVRSALDCTLAPPRIAADRGAPPAPGCGNRATADSFSGRGLPLDRVIRLIIAPRVGRPVLDRTGLAGTFDIALAFRLPDAPTGASGGPPSPSIAPPDRPLLETALQEQLGLKLQAIREPADVLVVDHVEPPSVN